MAFDGDNLWIIEVKDYTYPGAHQPEDLFEIFGRKAVGTLEPLYVLERAEAQSEARDFARICRSASRIHLVLHSEAKDGGRKERQIGSQLMLLKEKLKRIQKSIGLGKSSVTSTLLPDANTPWRARRDPDTRHRHADR